MKIVILCGGQGTRLREETEFRPKPMVEIGNRPILWHLMKVYAHYGYKEFILCLGYKGEIIKQYFYNYEVLNNDFTIELGNHKKIEVHNKHDESDWKVTLAETGDSAMTGARVKRIEKYINEDTFMLTYGDGLADINLKKLLEFHKSHGKLATITGVNPPSRYGHLVFEENKIIRFNEKPRLKGEIINGGYFVLNRKFLEYLSADVNCVLEKEPLENLAADGELMVYSHKGFWQCMDTYRDFMLLNSLWDSQDTPWKVWD